MVGTLMEETPYGDYAGTYEEKTYTTSVYAHERAGGTRDPSLGTQTLPEEFGEAKDTYLREALSPEEKFRKEVLAITLRLEESNQDING